MSAFGGKADPTRQITENSITSAHNCFPEWRLGSTWEAARRSWQAEYFWLAVFERVLSAAYPMTNLHEQAMACDDADRAAKIIQQALGIESYLA